MRDDLTLGGLASFCAVLSLTAFGGANAVAPEMQRQLVEIHGWMDVKTFAELFAVAQAAPGPNILLASLIGWRLAGLAGLAVASVAILGPASMLAFAAGRLLRAPRLQSYVRVLQGGLAPVGVGLILASGMRLSMAFAGDVFAALLCAAGAAWVLFTKQNPLWVILGGALVGIIHPMGG